PYLYSGGEHVRIETGGLINRAGLRDPWAAGGRQRDILLERKERKEPGRWTHRQRLAGSVRWHTGLGPDAEVIDQIVVDSKRCAHRPRSRACRVPGQAHARLQQQLGVILIDAGFPDDWIGLDHKAGVV